MRRASKVEPVKLTKAIKIVSFNFLLKTFFLKSIKYFESVLLVLNVEKVV